MVSRSYPHRSEEKDVVTLVDVHGMGLLSGWDRHGHLWVQCWIHCPRSDLRVLTCPLCGKPMTSDSEVWICAETGDVRCADHVEY
jgi:hypothetical protein